MRKVLVTALFVALVGLALATYSVGLAQTHGSNTHSSGSGGHSGGSGGHDAAATTDANVALAQKAVALLDKCSACHGHGWMQEGRPKVLWGQDVPRLIQEKWVVPGKPEESKTYQKIRDGKHPGNASLRPSAEDIKAFAKWITDGCLDPVNHATSQPASAPAHV